MLFQKHLFVVSVMGLSKGRSWNLDTCPPFETRLLGSQGGWAVEC